MDLTLNLQVLFDEQPIMLLLVRVINFPLLPPSGSFGVTKKAIAGRLGVAGPLYFCPEIGAVARGIRTDDTHRRLACRRAPPQFAFLCAKNFRH